MPMTMGTVKILNDIWIDIISYRRWGRRRGIAALLLIHPSFLCGWPYYADTATTSRFLKRPNFSGPIDT